MGKAASKSRLAELHRKFTEALIQELEEAGAENIPLPAADKSVIAKFLKDNDITADADSQEMVELRDAFDDDLAARREQKKQEILGRIGAEPGDDLQGII